MAILNKLNLRLSFMIMNFYAVKKSKKLKKFSPHAKLLNISLYKKNIYINLKCLHVKFLLKTTKCKFKQIISIKIILMTIVIDSLTLLICHHTSNSAKDEEKVLLLHNFHFQNNDFIFLIL